MRYKLPYPDRAEPSALAAWGRNLIQTLNRALDPNTSADPGEMKVWADTAAPTGWIIPAGQVLVRADNLNLFRALGTRFNTGGETGLQFRLPNPTNPFTGGRWIIKT